MKISVLILVLVLSAICNAQDVDGPFEVPSKYVSVILVSDPTCPLKLSEPTRVLGWPNGAIRIGFTIQNISTADVKSYDFEDVNWFGNSGHGSDSSVREDMRFPQWMTYSTFNDPYVRALPLDDQLAKKLRFTNVSKRFWIAMIVKVKLSDGRSYDATDKFKRLETFLNQLEFENYDLTDTEISETEKKVRDFVSTLMKPEPKQ